MENKKIRSLEKFYDKLIQSKTSNSIHFLKTSWDKYKSYYDVKDKNIKELYNKIDTYLDDKIEKMKDKKSFILTTDIYYLYTCENLQKDSNLLYEFYDFVSNSIMYYSKFNVTNIPSMELHTFLVWLEKLSYCIDLTQFKEKINEILEKIKIKKHKTTYDFNFKEYDTPMIIGDVLNKPPRNCSLVNKIECNNECEWSKYDNKCMNRNYIELLTHTYCSTNSYKSKDELILLIKSLYIDKNYKNEYKNLSRSVSNKILLGNEYYQLNEMTIIDLCKIFNNLLIKMIGNYDIDSIDGQLNFWRKINMGKNDLIQITSLIDNCAKNKYSFMEIRNTVTKWIKENKKTFIGITGLGVVVLAGLIAYSSNEYGVLNKTIENEDTQENPYTDEYKKNSQVSIKYNNPTYSPKKLDHTVVLNPRQYIPEIKLQEDLQERLDEMYTDITVNPNSYKYIRELLDNDINLDIISGEDKYLTPSECENALNILHLTKNPVKSNNYNFFLNFINSVNEYFNLTPKEIITDESMVSNHIARKNQNFFNKYVTVQKGETVKVQDIIFLRDFNNITLNNIKDINESIKDSFDIITTGINEYSSEIQYLFLHDGKYYAYDNYNKLISLNLINNNTTIVSTVFLINEGRDFTNTLRMFNNLGDYVVLP